MNCFRFEPWLASRLALASLCVGLTGSIIVSPAAAAFDLNRHGLTGSWFQAATTGQGVELEVYQDLIAPGTGFLQGAWFTYDYKAAGGAASQRWYTFSGNVPTGQASATLTLYQNTGGNFDALPVTTAMPVGSVLLTAADCTHITLAYTFTDGSARSGMIPMTRLLQNVTCSTSTASLTNPDFGYSGNWFVAATSGQGILFELNPMNPFAFFAWYTYAPNGQLQGEAGQRWYTGQASYTPGARSLPLTLYETTGGLFDSPTPAPNTVPVGTATATFSSCTALKLDFNFTGGSSAGSAGTINMSRVGPTPAGCGPAASGAEGLWLGTTSSNRTARAIILDDGTYYILYSKSSDPADAGVVQGSSSAVNGIFTSPDGFDFPIASSSETSDSPSPATINGTYEPRSSLHLTVSEPGGIGTLVASYDVRYETPASLAAAAGNYTGVTGHVGGKQPASFTLFSNGTFFGSNPVCAFSGTITPRPSVDVFDFTIAAPSGSTCIFGRGPISGVLYFDEVNRQIHGFAPFAGRTDNFYLIGTKP